MQMGLNWGSWGRGKYFAVPGWAWCNHRGPYERKTGESKSKTETWQQKQKLKWCRTTSRGAQWPLNRGVQPLGVPGPHWKKKSCLGPHIKYIATHNHKKSHNVFNKFTILYWAAFIAILSCMCSVGHRWDTPGSWKRHGKGFSPGISKKSQPCPHLDFYPQD